MSPVPKNVSRSARTSLRVTPGDRLYAERDRRTGSVTGSDARIGALHQIQVRLHQARSKHRNARRCGCGERSILVGALFCRAGAGGLRRARSHGLDLKPGSAPGSFAPAAPELDGSGREIVGGNQGLTPELARHEEHPGLGRRLDSETGRELP
jgi:hypothetical protein